MDAGYPSRPDEAVELRVGEKVVMSGSHGEWIGKTFEVEITDINRDADTVTVRYSDQGSKVWLRDVFLALLRRHARKDYQVGQAVVLKGDYGSYIGSTFNATIMKINREAGTVEVKYSSNGGLKVFQIQVFELLLVHCAEAPAQTGSVHNRETQEKGFTDVILWSVDTNGTKTKEFNRMPNGEKVTIMDTIDDEYKVKWNSHVGLVKKYHIQLDYQASCNIRCFVSGQITAEVFNRLGQLGAGKSIKASMPRFNKPPDEKYPPGMECIDIPCYGPVLTGALMKLFDVDIVKTTALDLRFMIPQLSINEVIQTKNKERGPQLVEAVRAAGGDPTSVHRLNTFVQKIQNLKVEEFIVNGKPRSDGKSWVDDYVVAGNWRDRLHVDVCLTNFGFSEDFCARFKVIPVVAGKKETWTEHAVGWLSKAFDVFSYQGSPSDVVNLIYATLGKPHDPKPNIDQVVDTVREFTGILQSRSWAKIVWKPNYMFQDSELDDMLAWLLCHTICSYTSSTLDCEVQLPPETQSHEYPSQIDYLHAQYDSRSTKESRVNVFRDPDSRNKDKVEYSACFVPPQTVYLASHTEMRAFVGKYVWNGDENMFVRGSARLYLHPFSGKWCVSLDVAGMRNDYYQIEAIRKGCLPHANLCWRMLVRPENRPQNAVKDAPLKWNQADSARKAQWQVLDKEGAPILDAGQVFDGPKPTFMFLISRTPLQRAESPPRCLWVKKEQPNVFACACDNGQRARSQPDVDGYTLCQEHRKKGRQNLACPVYIKARSFIYELGVTEFLDHQWDHCFCEACHRPDQEDVIAPSAWTSWHIAPRGWVGFGIIVPKYGVAYNQMWQWPNTFHGTRATLLPHILRHGQIGTPGDRLSDNSVLKSVNCAGRQDSSMFYTSPTIEYAGLQFYARPRKSSTMPGVMGQVVLQCNQNRDPGNVLEEKNETMGFRANGYENHAVCQYTPLYDDGSNETAKCREIKQRFTANQKHRIEIVSTKPELCVIRRVLVRTFDASSPPTPDRLQYTRGQTGKLAPIAGKKENFRSPVDLPKGTTENGDVVWM